MRWRAINGGRLVGYTKTWSEYAGFERHRTCMLVSDGTGVWFGRAGLYENGDWLTQATEGCLSPEFQTHWAPLPRPPKR